MKTIDEAREDCQFGDKGIEAMAPDGEDLRDYLEVKCEGKGCTLCAVHNMCGY